MEKKTLDIRLHDPEQKFRMLWSANDVVLSQQAMFALDMMRSGMLAAIPDTPDPRVGADARSYQTMTLMTPEQVVERAQDR